MITAGFVIEKITPLLIPFIAVWSIGLILLFQGFSAIKMNKLFEAREEAEKTFAEKQAELDAEREQDRKKYIDSVFKLESKFNEMQKSILRAVSKTTKQHRRSSLIFQLKSPKPLNQGREFKAR